MQVALLRGHFEPSLHEAGLSGRGCANPWDQHVRTRPGQT